MYIVTGGAGMIGSAMIWKLNSLGIDDILVVDHLASSEKWKNLVNRTFAEYVPREEFLERVRKGALPDGVKAVFHLGACSSTTERDVDYLFRNNLEYSKTLAAYALERGIRFVNASSAATYGDGARGFGDAEGDLDALKPLNAYGYSKHLFDVWARRTGRLARLASLKFFNVYGPNEYHKGDMRSVAVKAFAQICETGRMKLFASDRADYADGGQMRDFVYVKDCAAVMWWLSQTPEANGIFNLGTGNARTWNDLAAALFDAMGLEKRITYIPMPEQLRGKYQNFTPADMRRLTRAGCPVVMHTLEDGVRDYARNYLMTDDPCL
jgi:ADP-L-glycero-D-manno-heptose 6-epimerase